MTMQQGRALSRRTALAKVGRVGIGAIGAIGGLCAMGGLGGTASWAMASPEPGLPMPAELLTALPGAHPLGKATMRFLGLAVYEAKLWAQRDFQPSRYPQSPFALELNYFRGLSGPQIAERSLKEMRRQGPSSETREQAWLQAMVQAFPDVKAGDRITGLHAPGMGARFWFNGQRLPDFNDTEFSRTFFGIWLSEATSEPQMRASLLGQSAS